MTIESTAGTTSRRTRASRRSAIGLSVLLAAAVLAASCSANSSTANQGGPGGTTAAVEPAGANVSRTKGPKDVAQPQDGGSLVFAIEAEPEGMDPTRVAFSSSGHLVASAVFDPLLTLDAEGNVAPFLASAIEPSNGNKTWTLTIADGVTFHDGTPLDANVVKANLDAHASSLISTLALQDVTSVTAPDARHVVLELETPWANFPYVLTTQVGYVMHPSMITDPSKSNSPIGTGPFQFEGHAVGESWTFRKNPTYWRKGLPHLDALEFRPIPDHAARLEALEKGDVDMIHTYSPTEVKELRQSDYKIVEYNVGEEDVLSINTEKPPFDSLTARKALAAATDSTRWREEINQGVPQPATGPFAPGQLGHSEDNGYPAYDPAKAKELVKQYEQESGKKLEFTYAATGGPLDQTEAQLLQQLWQDAGMVVTIDFQAQLQHIARVVTGTYNVGDWRNYGNPDPDADAVWWRGSSVQPSGVSLNVSRYQNPDVDAAITEARNTSDRAARDAAYKKVARLLGENVAFIWLGRVNWVLAANPRVNGMYSAANGSLQTLGPKTWIGDLSKSR